MHHNKRFNQLNVARSVKTSSSLLDADLELKRTPLFRNLVMMLHCHVCSTASLKGSPAYSSSAEYRIFVAALASYLLIARKDFDNCPPFLASSLL